MLIILEAAMRGPSGPQPSAPALNLPDSLSWSESALGWQLSLPAQPEQAAQLIRRHRLQQHSEQNCVWTLSGDGAQFKLTVAGDDSDWQALQRALASSERLRSARPPERLQIEWPFFCPALDQLRPGAVQLGECFLEAHPEQHSLTLYAPVDEEGLDELREAGYLLQPVAAYAEDVMWGETVMGRVTKPPEEYGDPGPYEVLHGLATALGDSWLMAPFAPALEISDRRELERIVRDSCQQLSDEDESSPLDELDSTFRQEYSGVALDDVELMLRSVIGFTEGIGAETAERHDLEELPDEWMHQMFVALLAAMVCGSRIARAELARAGHDTDLGQALGDLSCQELINGQLSFAEAMRCAVGDDRAWRVWSLGWGPAQQVEALLAELLLPELPQDPAPEGVLGDLLVCFDLGVRYQMARVAPELLAPPLEVHFEPDEGEEPDEAPEHPEED